MIWYLINIKTNAGIFQASFAIAYTSRSNAEYMLFIYFPEYFLSLLIEPIF